MHYVALLSGGKDSCFNLLHCFKNGHKLKAAATLGPEPGQGEIDSYMYQTVGQDAIHLVAQALDVPLYRRTIKGTAMNQDLEYGSRKSLGVVDEKDETEDLFALLSTVKDSHPDITGVSVGAILSNYQRTRVEHVCQRLQLTPLCYLWQRDQEELFKEMIDSNMEAILIKIAGIGLTTRHLGMSLRAMHPTLLKLNKMYGAHICGEGGEYETLTLDCPLFKHRVVIDKSEIVVHSNGDFAPVAYLKVESAHLEPKPPLSGEPLPISIPKQFDTSDLLVYNSISPDSNCSLQEHDLPLGKTFGFNNFKLTPSFKKIGPWLVVGNVQVETRHLDAKGIEDETRECFNCLIGDKTGADYLSKFSMGLTDIAYITLLLSSMDFFPSVNAIYSTFFGRSPPARACIGVDLPDSNRLRIECIAFSQSDSTERFSLHVQGLSYWAPANIGPYSQTIVVGQRMFVSGQIGLLPANNVLPAPPSLREELSLSLRHIRNIVQATKQSHFRSRPYHIQSAIIWLTKPCHMQPIKLGISASELFRGPRIPMIFVLVKSLPKGALVETQVVLHGASSASDEQIQDSDPIYLEGDITDIHWEISFLESCEGFAMLIAFLEDIDTSLMKMRLFDETPLHKILNRVKGIRIFYTTAIPNVEPLLLQLFSTESIPSLMMVPSRMLATRNYDKWDCALLFFG